MDKWNSKKEFLICISIESIKRNGNLDHLSNNLPIVTNEIFEFLKKHKINFRIEDLNLFLHTNKIIEYFRKYIKKSYHKDYLDNIDRLKDLANRIQYYSSNQISIVLPKFSLNDTTIIKIFINYLKSKKYNTETINNIKKFGMTPIT